jgi:hypothetical protein
MSAIVTIGALIIGCAVQSIDLAPPPPTSAAIEFGEVL